MFVQFKDSSSTIMTEDHHQQQEDNANNKNEGSSDLSITVELLEDEDEEHPKPKRESIPPRRPSRLPTATKSMSPLQRRPARKGSAAPPRLPPRKVDSGAMDRRGKMMKMARGFRSETNLKQFKASVLDDSNEDDDDDNDDDNEEEEEIFLRSSATHIFLQKSPRGILPVIPPFRQRERIRRQKSSSSSEGLERMAALVSCGGGTNTKEGDDATCSHVPTQLPPRRSSSSRAPIKRSKSNISEYYQVRNSMMQDHQQDEREQQDDAARQEQQVDDKITLQKDKELRVPRKKMKKEPLPSTALHAPPRRTTKGASNDEGKRQQEKKDTVPRKPTHDLSSSKKDRDATFYKLGLRSLHLDTETMNLERPPNEDSINLLDGTQQEEGNTRLDGSATGDSMHLHFSREKLDKSQSVEEEKDEQEEESLHLSNYDLAPQTEGVVTAAQGDQQDRHESNNKALIYKEGLRSLHLSAKDLPKASSSVSKVGKAMMSAISGSMFGHFMKTEPKTKQQQQQQLSIAERIKARAEKNFSRQMPGRSKSLSEQIVRATPNRERIKSSGSDIRRRATPGSSKSSAGDELLRQIPKPTFSRTKQMKIRRCNTTPPGFMARMSSSYSSFEAIIRKAPKRSLSSAAALGGMVQTLQKKRSKGKGSDSATKIKKLSVNPKEEERSNSYKQRQRNDRSKRRAPIKRSNTWVKEDAQTRKSSGDQKKLNPKAKSKRPILRRTSSDSGQYFRDESEMFLRPSDRESDKQKIIKMRKMKTRADTQNKTLASNSLSAEFADIAQKYKLLARTLPRSNSAKRSVTSPKQSKREFLKKSHSGYISSKEMASAKKDLKPLPPMRFPQQKESGNVLPKQVPPATSITSAEPKPEQVPNSGVDTRSSLERAESALDKADKALGRFEENHPHFLDPSPQVHKDFETSRTKIESKKDDQPTRTPLRYTPPEPAALLPDLVLPDDPDDQADDIAIVTEDIEFSFPKLPELLPEPTLSEHVALCKDDKEEKNQVAIPKSSKASALTYAAPKPPALLPDPSFSEDDASMPDVDESLILKSWHFKPPEPPALLQEPTLSDHELLKVKEMAQDAKEAIRMPLTYSMPEPPQLLPDSTFLDEYQDLITDETAEVSSNTMTWEFSAPKPPSLLPEPTLPEIGVRDQEESFELDETAVDVPGSDWNVSTPENPNLLPEPSLPSEDDECPHSSDVISGNDEQRSNPLSRSALSWKFSAPEAPQLLPEPNIPNEEDIIDEDPSLYVVEDIKSWSFSAPEIPILLPEPTLPDEEEYDDDAEERQQLLRRFSHWDVVAASCDGDTDSSDDYDSSSGDSTTTSSSNSSSSEDEHETDEDVLMDLRRDFSTRCASMNDVMLRKNKSDLAVKNDDSSEPSESSENKDLMRDESIQIDDIRRGSLHMDDLALHSSAEHTEASMNISGNHYSMSILEKEEASGVLPAFSNVKIPASKPSFHASCSALDFVQFAPKNFVQQSQDRFEDHYELGQLLGEGEFGSVYLGYKKQGGDLGEERAIKIIDKNRMSKGDYDHVINEFNLLKGLTHPNLLTLYSFYEDQKSCYIVTDICKGGELWDEIDARGNFDEETAASFMTHLLSAVSYLQSHKICHRDINLENILLEEAKDLSDMKIIDFGLATKYEDGVKLTDLAGRFASVSLCTVYCIRFRFNSLLSCLLFQEKFITSLRRCCIKNTRDPSMMSGVVASCVIFCCQGMHHLKATPTLKFGR